MTSASYEVAVARWFRARRLKGFKSERRDTFDLSALVKEIIAAGYA